MAYKDMQNIAKWQKERKKKRKRRRQMEPNIPKVLLMNLPPPGDISNSGIKPVFSALAGKLFTIEPPGKPL